MSNETQVSFIIPIYNAERYIEETINSILTAKNSENFSYEVICVNDCSTDNSLAILNKLASQNQKVVIVNHEKNGHIAVARNSGFDAAKGKWICFLDADDIVNKNVFNVFDKVLDESYDIIYFDYDQFVQIPKADFDVTESTAVHEYGAKEIHIQQRELLSRRKMQGKTYGYRNLGLVWGKVYRASFLHENNFRAIEGMKYEEDLSFCLMCLSKCKKAKKIDWNMIHYRIIPDSFSHVYTDVFWKRFTTISPVYEQLVKKYFADDPEMQELLPYRYLWALLFSVIRGPANHKNHNPWSHRKNHFRELLSLPYFDHVFDHVNISELDFSNSLLAFCVKKRFLIGCCFLERMLQLKNRIVNFRN